MGLWTQVRVRSLPSKDWYSRIQERLRWITDSYKIKPWVRRIVVS